MKKFDLAFAVDPLFHKTSAQFDAGGASGAAPRPPPPIAAAVQWWGAVGSQRFIVEAHNLLILGARVWRQHRSIWT